MNNKPYDATAEAVVVASAMKYPGVYSQVASSIPFDALKFPLHKKIMEVTGQLITNNTEVTPELIIATMRQERTLTDQAEQYIKEKLSKHHPVQEVGKYIEVLHKYWIVRRTSELRTLVSDEAIATCPDVVAQIFKVVELGNQLLMARPDALVKPVKEWLYPTIEMIEKAQKTGLGYHFTGNKYLDNVIGGLPTGALTIIGGRPSTGKTALVQNWLKHMAEQGAPVAFISLEMHELKVMGRWISMESGIPLTTLLRQGRMQYSDFDVLNAACCKINELPLYIIHPGNHQLAVTKNLIRYAVTKFSVEVAAVDYVQLIECDARIPRHQQIDLIVKDLRELAIELGIAIILLSQRIRGDGGDILSTLAGSSGLENHSDVVILLTQSVGEPVGDNLGIPKNWVTVAISKNRDGPAGMVLYLRNDKEIFRFSDVDPEAAQEALSQEGYSERKPYEKPTKRFRKHRG